MSGLTITGMEKFNGDPTSLRLWMIKVKTILGINDLLGEITDITDYKSTSSTKEKAKSILILALADSVLAMLGTELDKSAKHIWTTIIDRYGKHTAATQALLRQRISRTTMSDTEKVTDYIERLVSLYNDLIASGETVSEGERLSKLLLSLSPSWHNLRDVIEVQQLTLDVAIQRLIIEQERRNMLVLSESAVAATVTTTPHNTRYSHKKTGYNANKMHIKSDKMCAYCKRHGHTEAECRRKANSGKNCNYCHSIGHTESECFKKQRHTKASALATTLKNENTTTLLHWVIDSGATHHMTSDKRHLNNYTEHKVEIMLGDHSTLTSAGKGDFVTSRITLKDVLHVPGLKYNLFSIKRATAAGCKITFSNDTCNIIKDNITIQIKANHLYETALTTIGNTRTTAELWHKRLGHANMRDVLNTVKQTDASVTDITDHFCDICAQAKQHRKSVPKTSSRARPSTPFDTIEADLEGPLPQSLKGERYYLQIVDGATRYRWIYIIKTKDEVCNIIKQFTIYAQNQHEQKIKVFHSDQGTEFLNTNVKKFLAENGIEFTTSAARTQAQNGIPERGNRTIMEMARALLIMAGLPTALWPDAVKTAVYLLNRISRKGALTPYQLLYRTAPDLSALRVFGCIAYALNPSPASKFAPRNVKAVMVGYEPNQGPATYRLYSQDDHKYVTTRDVLFDENAYGWRNQKNITANEQLDISQLIVSNNVVERSQEPSVSESAPPAAVERSAPPVDVTPEPAELAPIISDQIPDEQPAESRYPSRTRERTQFFIHALTASGQDDTPTTIAEALTRSDADKWRQAIDKELAALRDNQVYEVQNRNTIDKDVNIIDSKMVFKIKADETYKARLVARGFKQRHGIDYNETFATVARAESFKILLAIAHARNLAHRHIDIKTAFLNGDLHQPVYLVPPVGTDAHRSGELWLLRRSLYGLKQAPHEWHIKLDTLLTEIGFTSTNADTQLYRRKQHGGEDDTLLAVHVDDILLVGTTDNVNNTVTAIAKKFELTDHCNSNMTLLNIDITREDNGFYLSQSRHIASTLELAGMTDCKPVSTPQPSGLKLNKAKDEAHTAAPYRQVIGKLIYLLMTRPDIAATLSILSQHVAYPTDIHWHALQHLLRYLKKTIDMRLHIGGTDLTLHGYSDSSYADDKDSRCSQQGYIFFLGDSPISWRSKRQQIVALSSTEAEYMAMGYASRNAIWLRSLLGELGLIQPATLIRGDNQGAIALAHNPTHHEKSKHIDVVFHRIRDWIKNQRIKLQYCGTSENVADIFTKGLTHTLHRQALQYLQLC